MGSSGSKSVFDRRNSVERRTQRRQLQNFKAKVDQLAGEVEKLNPSSDEGHVERIRKEVLTLKREMPKRCARLQHKNRPMYDSLYQRLDPLLEKITVRKLQDLSLEEGEAAAKEPEQNANKETNNNNNNTQEQQQTQKVELTLVRFESPKLDEEIGPRSKAHRDGEVAVDRRESILKMGIPVMPDVAHELPNKIAEAKRTSIQAREKALRTVEMVKEDVRDLEIRINSFVGRRNGKHYRLLRHELEKCHYVISGVEDGADHELQEQKELMMRYIGNCLSFLEEKATAAEGGDDEESENDDEVFCCTTPTTTEPSETNNNNKTTTSTPIKQYKSTLI